MAPKRGKRNKSKRYSCELCSAIDNKLMAICAICESKYHFKCLGITSVDKDVPFNCPDCKDEIQLQREEAIQKLKTSQSGQVINNSHQDQRASQVDRDRSIPHKDVKSQTSKSHTNDCPIQSSQLSNHTSRVRTIIDDCSQSDKSKRQSQHTRSSIKRRTQLDLERIEEERQLKEKRDKEYLDEKYRVLANDYSSESDKLSTDRSSFTRSWVQQQQHDVNQSMQVNSPSTDAHSVDSTSIVNENINATVNQLIDGRQSTKFRSASMDCVNPRLLLGPEKYLLKKIDQIVLNESTSKSRQQMEQQIGLSINQTEPIKLMGTGTVSKRTSCPVHDAKLHTFNGHDELPSISKCLAKTNNPKLNDDKVYEWTDHKDQSKGHEYLSEYYGGMINDQWSKYQPKGDKLPGEIKQRQSTPKHLQEEQSKFENRTQVGNFNVPHQYRTGVNDFVCSGNKNQKPWFKEPAIVAKESSHCRDNYSRETGKYQSNIPQHSDGWYEPQIPQRFGNTVEQTDLESDRREFENQRRHYESTRLENQEPQHENPTHVEFDRRKDFENGERRTVNYRDVNETQQVHQNENFLQNDYNTSEDMGAIGTSEGPIIENQIHNHSDRSNATRIPEGCQILTRSQIASRQVVDRKLPKFTGNPDEWIIWHKKFVNTTNMCGLNEQENLERLEKCLDGKARDAVRSQLWDPGAVPMIIKTLEMLYGRPELIIRSLIKKIRLYPEIKADRLDQLIEFAFEVQNISATIESLKRLDHLTDPMLVEELVNKLPAQERKDWAKYKMRMSNVTLKTLSLWLYELAEILCSIAVPATTKSNDQSDKKERRESHRVNSHIEKISKPDSSPKRNFSCLVCGKGCDKFENCSTFKSSTTECRWKTIIQLKLCRKCLRRHKFPCRSTINCDQNGCQYKEKHHSMLHNSERHNKEVSIVVATNVNSNVHLETSDSTLLRFVPVMLHHNGISVKTFAFFDDGSTATMMEKHLANELGLNGTPEQLCLIWTKKIHRTEPAEKVTLEISGINESDRRYPLRGIRSVNSLELPIQSINKAELIKKYSYLKDVPIVDYSNAMPGILIGSDNPKLATQLKVVEGKGDNNPIASKTRLGWTVHGPRNQSNEIQFVNNHKFEVCPYHNQLDDEIHQRVKEYFSVENFGVQANSKLKLESKDEERALDMLDRLTDKKNGKYETGLLWKNDEVTLPDSLPMAMKRLISLEKQGTEVIKSLGAKINDYVAKGYARKLSEKELKYEGPVWYLPIFGVVHPKKPEKLRMVFDAAAKVKSTSLNSVLLKGPDLYTSLVDILRRFRERKCTGGGDIVEMFHQVSVIEKDRHFQRFLFREDSKKKPDVYEMDVMTFGSICSPSSAQFVKNKNAAEFNITHPRAVSAIIDNHYVDDMMECEHTEEGMIKLMQDVRMIHAHGGFNITKFISNSENVLKALNEGGTRDVKDIAPKTELKVERVLGMWYDTKCDIFTFSLKYTLINQEILCGKKLPTKREVLRILMSIFDPLGFLSNYLIHLKILLQEIWRAEIDWDEQISTKNLVERWKQWLEILPGVENVKVPRLYSTKMSPMTPKSLQLHVFVDASEDAFSAIVYLRVEDEYGVDCALMGSKARVAPLKYLSIPRKELQAAVLGTRLMTSIGCGQRFKVDRRIIWSDSETVLSWLNSNHRKYSQFVAHRVGEILEGSDVNEWRWIPTKENIADEATKWTKIPTFEASNRWFSGPKFIHLNEDQWPTKKSIKLDCEEEMKAHFVHSSFVVPQLIDPQRFSNWNRMIRALALAIRFRRLLTGGARKDEPLRQEEIHRAENLIYRQAQFEGYPSEMVILERNKTLPIDKYVFIEKPSSLFDGSPYLDVEGVLRMKGRIDGHRDLSLDTKRPIILPKHARITELLLHQYHIRYFHQNHETVVNEIRQKFYIPNLRTVFQKVRKRCQMCKVKRAHPQAPQMADLPPARLATRFSPFSYVGIDYFGPMYVAVGRRREKRRGVLFTCLTIRAVHIELANSIDTNECIMCIRNFITRHGTPIEIHSDCGSNLDGANNELERERRKINDAELSAKFTSTYTRWIFTAPTAAHMGGSWERLIQSVKSDLDEILPTRTPKENMINSRPLTYIPF